MINYDAKSISKVNPTVKCNGETTSTQNHELSRIPNYKEPIS